MSDGESRKPLAAWIVGLGVLAIVLFIDWSAHHHAPFERDGINVNALPGFYPLFGAGCALALVLAARTLAVALKRKDTFYADD